MIFNPFLRLMCLDLVRAQSRRETKGTEGQAARAKTAGKDCRAAGSVKNVLILETKKKNICIQEGTRHIDQVIEINLKGKIRKMQSLLVFGPNRINSTCSLWPSGNHRSILRELKEKSIQVQQLLEKRLHSMDIW